MPESRGEKLEVNLVVGDDGLAAEVLVVSPQDDHIFARRCVDLELCTSAAVLPFDRIDGIGFNSMSLSDQAIRVLEQLHGSNAYLVGPREEGAPLRFVTFVRAHYSLPEWQMPVPRQVIEELLAVDMLRDESGKGWLSKHIAVVISSIGEEFISTRGNSGCLGASG
jgi:hypothetical protein